MSNDWVYSEKVKEHFMNPKNFLEENEDFQADGQGTVGNMKCGDEMMFLIKVNKEKGIIEDCRWKTFGCASAIASTSLLSELIKGMPVDKAYHITYKDITDKLEGLPDHKIHCSVLGDKALRHAIDDYYEKTDQGDKIESKRARVICICMNVTDEDIKEAVLDGARTYLELQEHTKIGTVCGKCKDLATTVMNKNIDKYFPKK